MDVVFLPLLNVLNTIIYFYMWAVIVRVVMSWLVNFDVINTSNQFIALMMNFLAAIIEPVLEKVRRFLPTLAGFDFSPLVLILGLMFISNVIARLATKLV